VAQFNVIVSPTSADTITNTGYVNGLESNQVINVKAPTAIGLVAFTADRTPGGVRLRWRTSQENSALGFRLYRASSALRQGATLATSALIAATGAAAGSEYVWLDASAPPAGVVYYWLEEVDTSGATTEYGPAVTGEASGLTGAPPNRALAVIPQVTVLRHGWMSSGPSSRVFSPSSVSSRTTCPARHSARALTRYGRFCRSHERRNALS
jgi:hypothetical protein